MSQIKLDIDYFDEVKDGHSISYYLMYKDEVNYTKEEVQSCYDVAIAKYKDFLLSDSKMESDNEEDWEKARNIRDKLQGLQRYIREYDEIQKEKAEALERSAMLKDMVSLSQEIVQNLKEIKEKG